MKKKFINLFFLLMITTVVGSFGQTVVERHGQLHVSGSKLKDQCNRNT